MSDKLAALLRYGVQEIDGIESNCAEFLQGAQHSLSHTTGQMLTSATLVLVGIGMEDVSENVNQTIKRHTAVVFAIKTILQVGEFLKETPEKPAVAMKKAKQELKDKINGAPKPAVTRGPVSTDFNLDDYDNAEVTKAQRIFRKGLMRIRLQQFVIEYRESKVSADQKKRANVLREIVATEESYCASLNSCIHGFLFPLRQDCKTKSYIQEPDLPTIFSTIELIYSVNSAMLHDLQARLKQWPNVNNFGSVFVAMIPMMKIYTGYIKNYDASIETLKRLQENKAFSLRVEELRAKCGERLDLPSLLIQPVQRLPRYQMLLHELIKHTDPSHVDIADLELALSKVQSLNKAINEQKRQADGDRLIASLQTNIQNLPIVLQPPKLAPGATRRVFIKEGDIAGYSNKNAKKRTSHMFLFNDMLIRTREIKKDSYEFEETITFSGQTDLSAPSGVFFTIDKGDITWYFEAESELQLKEWHGELKHTIDAWQLQELCNDEIAHSSSNSLQILSATYGDLSDSKHCIEVTQQLRCLVANDKLQILGDVEKSKLPGFFDPVNPSGRPLGSLSLFRKKTKKQLCIVWTDITGPRNRTFGDTEPVQISYKP
eukprot:TRINITY_DN766_c3_g2_i2.p1 TRINITY_DN766_c3_g2~~TRINITY_DN766_c3_g2_i2.p1  ORF type:complete len:602 (+),score=111.10 TRINITY_DN766_c3_g2_i2:1036-2841(+)